MFTSTFFFNTFTDRLCVQYPPHSANLKPSLNLSCFPNFVYSRIFNGPNGSNPFLHFALHVFSPPPLPFLAARSHSSQLPISSLFALPFTDPTISSRFTYFTKNQTKNRILSHSFIFLLHTYSYHFIFVTFPSISSTPPFSLNHSSCLHLPPSSSNPLFISSSLKRCDNYVIALLMATINDLPDTVITKLYEYLGVGVTLTAPALVRLSSAFSLALTNTRFMTIFCASSSTVDTSLQPSSAGITFVPYAFFPPTMEQSLIWYLRHASRLQKLVLDSMSSFPPFMDILPTLNHLRHLQFSREMVQDNRILSFPHSVTSLAVEAPTSAILAQLTAQALPSLKVLSLIHLETSHLPHLQALISRFQTQLEKLSLSFAVCCQCNLGMEDSKSVTHFLSSLTTPHTFALSSLQSLEIAIAPTFLIHKENDPIAFRRLLRSLLSKRHRQRSSPKSSSSLSTLKSLQKVSLYTDFRHAHSWSKAISSIFFNPNVIVQLSLGYESVTIIPQGGNGIDEKVETSRFALQFFDDYDERRFPCLKQVTEVPIDQVHVSRNVLDRMIIDNEFNARITSLLRATPSIDQLYVHACFAQPSCSFILSSKSDHADRIIQKIKQMDSEEASITKCAHIALNRILKNIRNLKMLRLKLDFAHSFMCHDDPGLLDETIASVPYLESLVLILPSKSQQGSKYSGVVTSTLLSGLITLLDKLQNTCFNLKYITIDISSEAMIGHCPSFQTRIALRDALQACDAFSRARTDIECHPLRALFELWEDSFYGGGA